MEFENNNTNQQEPVEETTQYTGCDEELSQEITDEEYEQMMEEIPEEEYEVAPDEAPEKKDGLKEFIADLKDKAVCKLLFLFAAIGFIFPFFSEFEKCAVTTFTTGIDSFKT